MPFGMMLLQVTPQLIEPTLLVTTPDPVPAGTTVIVAADTTPTAINKADNIVLANADDLYILFP